MKRKIIISSCIIILAVLAGVGIYVYNNTDCLKSNKQLFWKYGIKNTEITNMFNNDDINKIKSLKNQTSYKENANIDVKVNDDIYELKSESNAKNSNDIATKIELTKNSENIVDFNLVKKSNIVGLKLDELANGYITLKNSDLKDLAAKIGIEDTDKIPDNINWGTYMDLFEILDNDKEYITEKYTKLIISDTDSKNYSKENNIKIKIDDKIHTAEAYKITLSEKEVQTILSDICETISKDSRLLNLISAKLKILNFPSEYTKINNISNKFTDLSKNINSENASNDTLIEIIVYKENSELLQTNFKIGEDRSITLIYDKNNSKINIKQDITNESSNILMLNVSDYINKIINQVQEINITTKISDNKNEVETKIEVLCKENIIINYNDITTITNNIEENTEYDNSTKIILNNLTDVQLKNLYKAVIKSINNIWQDKKNLILNQ